MREPRDPQQLDASPTKQGSSPQTKAAAAAASSNQNTATQGTERAINLCAPDRERGILTIPAQRLSSRWLQARPLHQSTAPHSPPTIPYSHLLLAACILHTISLSPLLPPSFLSLPPSTSSTTDTHSLFLSLSRRRPLLPFSRSPAPCTSPHPSDHSGSHLSPTLGLILPRSLSF